MNKLNLALCLHLVIMISHLTVAQPELVSSTPNDPAFLTVYNGSLYFRGDDDISNAELWSYDPSTGSRRVTDIAIKEKSSSPKNLKVYGGSLYFSATNDRIGEELWKFTSSTEARLELVRDIYPGLRSSNPYFLTIFEDHLFFTTESEPLSFGESHRAELWRYHPTTGLHRVLNFISPLEYGPQDMIVYDRSLYFSGIPLDEFSQVLWRYNSVTGLERVSNTTTGVEPKNIGDLTVYHDMLYFYGSDGEHGQELWVYNPTDGAKMAADIQEGPRGSTPGNFQEYNDELYFRANDGIHGTELWRYNPEYGAVLVSDINPGPRGSEPNNLIEFQNSLYMVASNGINGAELMKFHPARGTSLVADINPGADHSSPRYITLYEDALYFNANDGIHGQKLWKYSPPPPYTIIPDRLRDYQRIEMAAWAKGRDWCWTGPLLDWQIPSACGQDFPCPDQRFGISLTDQNQKVVWQEAVEQPLKLEFPFQDTEPYTLNFSTLEDKLPVSFLKLAPELVPAGVAGVSMTLYPSEGTVSLNVQTDRKSGTPLVLYLTDAQDQILWKKVFKAPFQGKFSSEIRQPGTTLVLAVVKKLGPVGRPKGSVSLIPPGTFTPTTIDKPWNFYPNPVVDQRLYLDMPGSPTGTASLKIVSLTGQEIHRQLVPVTAGQPRLQVNLPSIPPGSYLLKVQQGIQHYAQRILVQD